MIFCCEKDRIVVLRELYIPSVRCHLLCLMLLPPYRNVSGGTVPLLCQSETNVLLEIVDYDASTVQNTEQRGGGIASDNTYRSDSCPSCSNSIQAALVPCALKTGRWVAACSPEVNSFLPLPWKSTIKTYKVMSKAVWSQMLILTSCFVCQAGESSGSLVV